MLGCRYCGPRCPDTKKVGLGFRYASLVARGGRARLPLRGPRRRRLRSSEMTGSASATRASSVVAVVCRYAGLVTTIESSATTGSASAKPASLQINDRSRLRRPARLPPRGPRRRPTIEVGCDDWLSFSYAGLVADDFNRLATTGSASATRASSQTTSIVLRRPAQDDRSRLLGVRYAGLITDDQAAEVGGGIRFVMFAVVPSRTHVMAHVMAPLSHSTRVAKVQQFN